eukprot:TRINITY_DN1554_c0_g1_i1.p1 TRINITY_DN1554_c0_g1~~TRINITY_DN1554_c0_g1_i1.p1  ORF type:complete len:485 (+),score=136.31 TRINITY_DN1554_c0_g1_i1:42-1496(+)
MSDEMEEKNAVQWKEDGNKFYLNNEYDEAIKCYSKAIELSPEDATYYGNRAQAYMMCKLYEKSINDCEYAIKLDPNFTKAFLRIANCHLQKGRISQSKNYYNIALKQEPNNKTALDGLQKIEKLSQIIQEAKNLLDKSEYDKTLHKCDQGMQISSENDTLYLIQADAFVKLKKYGEASKIATIILRSDPSNTYAYFIRGSALYYQGNLEQALSHFTQALKIDPEDSKNIKARKICRNLEQIKEKGNKAFGQGNFEEAELQYSEALKVDPENFSILSQLHCNRAATRIKLSKFSEGVEDCNKALIYDKKYLKAFIRRGDCFMKLGKFQEAITDYKAANEIEESKELKHKIHDAELELKKSKRKDYYQILGVARNADQKAIRKAYKKGVMEWHPDRHPPERKKMAEEKFKSISESYDILSDPKKKQRFDSGADIEEESMHDHNDMFQEFFSRRGGNPFGGGGFGGGSPFGGGGSPFGNGGFSFSFN